jgi:uncharacterized protein (TIGR00299 family) protein
MKILYYDCFSGISGDMNLAAMIDLGIESQYLRNELNKLNLDGWELIVEKDQRHGIYGTKVTVNQTIKDQSHRHLSDIAKIVSESDLNSEVKLLSMKMFETIAEAEASVHNTSKEKIHFHEVGAIDSIIDIVGAAICYNKLKVDKVIISRLELGGGFVKCAHGNLPVPAPATAEIIKGIPVSTGGVNFEATTPTGAAIIKTLGNTFGIENKLTVSSSGYGIGHKVNDSRPNILRLYLGEEPDKKGEGGNSSILECNIDDMNPEWYDTLTDKLLEAGASDVFLSHIIMKKGRPGIKVSVLVHNEKIEEAKTILFKHSTTLGLRIMPVEKVSLERQFEKIITPIGEVTMKYGYYRGEMISAKPEFEDCKRISLKKNIPLKEVYTIVTESAKKNRIERK